MTKITTHDWPTDEHEYWWMECKPNRKIFRLLVTVGQSPIDGSQYVQPVDDNNCYAQGCADRMDARFSPCIPPIFPERSK